MTVPYTFANATGNIPLAELDANFANVGGYANTSGTVTTNAQPNITTVGTLAYLSSTGNISATYFIGNGSQLTGIVANSSYSNANVQSYLPTYTGTLAGGNIVTTGRIQALGNVSGNFFVGNGSQLTGITGNYSNTNVASYLTTYTGNLTGNTVTANFFIGDGSGLTNLPAGNYGNSNVEAYLPSSNTIISINSNVANTNSNVANLTTALGNTDANVANLVTITTNTDSNVANIISNVTTLQGEVYSNANVANYLPTFSGDVSGNTFTTGNIIPSVDNTYFLGNATNRWANLWLGPGTIYITDANVASNATAELTVLNGVLQVNGVPGLQANLVSGNSTLTVANSGNITLNAGGSTDELVVSPTGTAITGNLAVSGNILGNIQNFSSTGNVYAGIISATGNVTGGNIISTGNIYGNIIGNIISTPTYGSFYDTATQTNSNVGNGIPMNLRSVDISNGITVVGTGNTEITISKSGVYNIQFSAQLNKTGGGADDIYIWLDKNGTSVPNSATALYLVGNNAKTVAAWNFVVSATAGDYYRIMWEAGSADIEILAEVGAGDVPAIPSVILTVVPVGA